jgi:nucleoside-diphosphate-sugar epimerase
VRLSNVYGPRERARASRPRVSVVARLIESALFKKDMVVYREDPARDWTYAPDIGRALLALMEAPACRYPLYHVASGQVLAPLAVVRAIGALLPEVRIEERAGTDPDAPPLTRRGYLRSERLRQDVGFDRWTPFEQGLRATIGQQRAEVSG